MSDGGRRWTLKGLGSTLPIVAAGSAIPWADEVEVVPALELEQALGGPSNTRRKQYEAIRRLQAELEQALEGQLTMQELTLCIKAVQDVWKMESDDEPMPNAATRTWRKLRALASGAVAGDGGTG